MRHDISLLSKNDSVKNEKERAFYSDQVEQLFNLLGSNVTEYVLRVLEDFKNSCMEDSGVPKDITGTDLHLIDDIIKQAPGDAKDVLEAKQSMTRIISAYGNLSPRLYGSRRIDRYSTSRLDALDRDEYDVSVDMNQLLSDLDYVQTYVKHIHH